MDDETMKMTDNKSLPLRTVAYKCQNVDPH